MEKFNAYAIALQKQLLILRQRRDQLKMEGQLLQSERLARVIDEIEAVLSGLPDGLKPPTLH